MTHYQKVEQKVWHLAKKMKMLWNCILGHDMMEQGKLNDILGQNILIFLDIRAFQRSQT